MGAYANPQEIEGQFDATQNQRNVQHMFDTLTASSIRNSEALAAQAKVRQENTKKIVALKNKQAEEKVQFNAELNAANVKNDTGISTDFLGTAVEEFGRLNSLPTRSSEENTTLAQLKALPIAYKETFGVINAFSTKTAEALGKTIGTAGSIDTTMSNPALVELTQNLVNKKNVKFGFAQDNGNKLNYNSFTASSTEDGSKAFNLTDIKNAFNSNGNTGITLVPDPLENINKIQTQAAAQPNGTGIFIMKDNEFTNRVNENYLDKKNYVRSEPKNQTEKGFYRVDYVQIDKEKIYNDINDQTSAIIAGSQEKVNYLPSWNNNFIQPAFQKQKEAKFKKGDNDLKDWEKYKDSGMLNGGSADEIKNNLENFKHNQKVFLLNALPSEQATGTADGYYVSKKAALLENQELKKDGQHKDIYNFISKKFQESKKSYDNDNKEITLTVGDDKIIYKAIATKTKDGSYKYRIIDNISNQNNEQ